MKKIRKKPGLKGFTLVELMTVLVIMTILIAIASGVIITTFNIFGKNTMMRAAQNEGNNVYNYIYDHISYAKALKIKNSSDINYKDDFETLKDMGVEFKDDVSEPEKEADIKDYFEKITVFPVSDKGYISLKRSTVNSEVYVYGDVVKHEDNSTEIKTPANFDCCVSFEPYTGNGTVSFKVQIKRDGEVFYEKSGAAPLFNRPDSAAIDIDQCSNSTGTVKIIYTYIQ